MIYLAADIHGHIRLPWLKEKLERLPLTENDFLLIAGDAGIAWRGEEMERVISFYANLPCQVLFIDGNHEDFTNLYRFPTVDYHGGKAHQIGHNIFHLMRGEIFRIGSKKIFCFGGGFSSKILTNSSPIHVWKEELPIDSEYENGLSNLKKHSMKVNLIVSHSAPLSIAKHEGLRYYQNDTPLLEYLDGISRNTSFDRWYFGHYHRDISIDKYTCLYQEIVSEED